MGRRIIVMTHKGWFGLCPIWAGGLLQDQCYVEARHRWLEWLFDVSTALFSLRHTVEAALGEHDLRFSLRLTGEIRHRIRVVDDADEP